MEKAILKLEIIQKIFLRLINLIFLEYTSITPTNQLPHEENKENNVCFVAVGNWQALGRYSASHT